MLPRNVQDQIDTAKSLQDQLNKPVEEQNPATEAALETQQDPELQSPAQPAALEPQPETRDASYWRHRFDVLQGKYNAEVPALRKEIATLTEQLAAAGTPSGESAAQRAQSAVADLSAAEIEEYGPELVNLIQRVVGKAVGGTEQGDLKEIKSELGQLREERQQDAVARFWSELEIQVPNFRKVNADSGFHAWLAEVDPLSGQARQQLLVAAQQALDPYRVSAIFKSFAKPASAKPTTPTIPADQVQPRQTKAAVPESQQRTWSRTEIGAFYRDKASGRYSAEEAAAIEADIFLAQAQGRIH
ncbi:hypothetical protein [Pseudomonas sp. B392_1p]|uniref:hypothetical protein n=1 Tax=Pseudomonas sp. B392_1p TaxID=3457507 RepID=UPI003FD4A9D0